jgi:ubiquitin-like protein Pup
MTIRQANTVGHAWAGIVTCAEGGQQQARRTGDTSTSTTEAAVDNLSEKGEKLKEEMDALIDEIDEVLEENAEEFVKNYVQRGGE